MIPSRRSPRPSQFPLSHWPAWANWMWCIRSSVRPPCSWPAPPASWKASAYTTRLKTTLRSRRRWKAPAGCSRSSRFRWCRPWASLSRRLSPSSIGSHRRALSEPAGEWCRGCYAHFYLQNHRRTGVRTDQTGAWLAAVPRALVEGLKQLPPQIIRIRSRHSMCAEFRHQYYKSSGEML